MAAIRDLLLALELPSADIDHEIAAMESSVIATTADRREKFGAGHRPEQTRV